MTAWKRRKLAKDAARLARRRAAGDSCWTCRRHKMVGAQSLCVSSSQVGTVPTAPDRLCVAWCAP